MTTETKMTDERALELLRVMREDGGAVSNDEWIRACDHIAARLRGEAAQAAPAVPEGWALVPVEPALEMCNAGWREVHAQGIDADEIEVAAIYTAMLAAAPAPVAGGAVRAQLEAAEARAEAAEARAEAAEARAEAAEAEIDWINAQPDDDGRMFAEIEAAAKASYRRHQSSVRGQVLTRADQYESHLVWAALEWAARTKEQQS